MVVVVVIVVLAAQLVVVELLALIKPVVPGVNTTTRSCRARSSSRWKVWFNERAEPRRVRRAVLALVIPSIWMARKTSLLPSDLREDTSTHTGRESNAQEANGHKTLRSPKVHLDKNHPITKFHILSHVLNRSYRLQCEENDKCLLIMTQLMDNVSLASVAHCGCSGRAGAGEARLPQIQTCYRQSRQSGRSVTLQSDHTLAIQSD